MMRALRAGVAAATLAGAALAAVGQQPPRGAPPAAPAAARAPDDGTWNRRSATAGDYTTVLEVSGREEVGRFMERPSNPEDLRSSCEAKQQAPKVTIDATERYLASLTAK